MQTHQWLLNCSCGFSRIVDGLFRRDLVWRVQSFGQSGKRQSGYRLIGVHGSRVRGLRRRIQFRDLGCVCGDRLQNVQHERRLQQRCYWRLWRTVKRKVG